MNWTRLCSACVGLALVVATAGGLSAQVDRGALETARKALERGDSLGAFQALDPGSAAARDRGDVPWLRLLGQAAMGCDRAGRAADAFDWIAKRDDSTAADWVNLAWSRYESAARLEASDPRLARAGFLDAVDAAQGAVDRAKADPAGWRFLAAALARAGEGERSDRAYANGIAAIQASGGDPTALANAQIDALIAAGRIDDAHAAAKSLADPVVSGLADARVWSAAGRNDRATETVTALLVGSPTDRRIYDALWNQLSTTDAKRGAEILRDIAAKHPQEFLAHAYHGNFLVAAENFDAAATAFAQCLLLKPEDTWARYALADLLERRVLALEKNARADPDDVKTAFANAVTAWLGYLERASAKGDLDPSAVSRVDMLIYRQSRTALDPDRAYPAYQRFIKLFPDRHLHWHVFSLICQDAGHLDEAEEAIARAIRDCPTTEAERRTQYINDRGLLYEAREDHDKAKASYLEASAGKGKGRADGFENLGKLHFKLGNPKKAVGYFRQVLEIDPERRQSLFYYHLCRRWLARERYFEAK